jgi:DNA adenine methylase
VNFFRVLQDKDKQALLTEKLQYGLYSRAVFGECLENLHKTELSDIDRAYCFYIVNKQSFGGLMETFGAEVKEISNVAAFYNNISRFCEAHARFRNTIVECLDFEKVINRYDRRFTFFYLDPPYAPSSARSGRRCYSNEISDEQHEKLVDLLLNIQGMAMLSGYDTPIYGRLCAAGWHKIDLGDSNVCMNKRVDGDARIVRREFVWVNYDA